MNDVFDIISKTKIVPVLTFNSTVEVEPTLDAIIKGDIKVAEICFRTECAFDSIKLAINKYKDVLIGAGTVINKEQAIKAINAGAKFIVSPGLSEEVFNICKDNNIPYFPGVVTPTEIMKAIDLGLTVLKFFPAGIYGGLKAINALGAAFPQVKFMPTGGVNLDNLKEFISNDKIFACGGSFVTKGTYDEITSSCLKARSIIKGE